MDKIHTGREGERMAADYLVSLGYAVVARNFRYKKGEIDIIVTKGNWLIFVEVKTRTSSAYGEPEYFITKNQARNIFNAAEAYIIKIDWHGHVRFDVISIKLGEETEVLHFEDAIN